MAQKSEIICKFEARKKEEWFFYRIRRGKTTCISRKQVNHFGKCIAYLSGASKNAKLEPFEIAWGYNKRIKKKAINNNGVSGFSN